MKVAYKDWSKAVESYGNVTENITIGSGDSAVDVEVKKYIPFEEYIDAVNEVVEMCTSGDRVFYSMRDFAFKVVVLKHYTNINCDVSLEHMSELIYKTDIIDKVCKVTRGAMKMHAVIGKELNRINNEAMSTREIERMARKINEFFEKIPDFVGDVSDDDLKNLIDFAGKVSDMNPTEIYKESVKLGIVGDEK